MSTKQDIPRSNRDAIDIPEGPLTAGEWARLNGFDRKTRTYKGDRRD